MILQPQKFHFFQTFLDLFDHLSETPPKSSLLRLNAFREFVLKEKGKTLETLQLFAPQFIPYLLKPQKLLYDHPEFYIINDYVTNTYAICFRDLTMVDVDCPDEQDILEFCADYLEWLIAECEKCRHWRLGKLFPKRLFALF